MSSAAEGNSRSIQYSCRRLVARIYPPALLGRGVAQQDWRAVNIPAKLNIQAKGLVLDHVNAPTSCSLYAHLPNSSQPYESWLFGEWIPFCWRYGSLGDDHEFAAPVSPTIRAHSYHAAFDRLLAHTGEGWATNTLGFHDDPAFGLQLPVHLDYSFMLDALAKRSGHL